MEPGQLKNVDSVPWRGAFPEYRQEDLPGVSLLGARTKEGMTQTRLSELTSEKDGDPSKTYKLNRPSHNELTSFLKT